jgi:hypothetical protein
VTTADFLSQKDQARVADRFRCHGALEPTGCSTGRECQT